MPAALEMTVGFRFSIEILEPHWAAKSVRKYSSLGEVCVVRCRDHIAFDGTKCSVVQKRGQDLVTDMSGTAEDCGCCHL
jgi:hypothetical protein